MIGRSRYKCHIPVYVLALVIAILLLAGPALAKTITLVADEWPPFNTTPGGENQGYLVDIAREVFEPLGHKVVYKLVPWARAITDTRKGLYNGAIGASRGDAPDFVFPEEELARNKLVFYVRKDSDWVFTEQNSLENVLLGCVKDYDYRKWLLEYIGRNAANPKKVFTISGDAPLGRLLDMLRSGRVDVVVDSEAAIRYVAKEKGLLEAIKPAGYDSEVAFIHIAFSPALPDSQELAGILTAGIRRLRESGRLKEILAVYGLEDWKKLSVP